jgi:hypothetical protein
MADLLALASLAAGLATPPCLIGGIIRVAVVMSAASVASGVAAVFMGGRNDD